MEGSKGTWWEGLWIGVEWSGEARGCGEGSGKTDSLYAGSHYFEGGGWWLCSIRS